MNVDQRLEELFNIPRMGHAALEPHNSVRGLYELVKLHITSDTEMVEIGSFQGVSTMLFALFAKKVNSVDCYDYVVPPTGRIPSHDQLFVDAEKVFIERTSHIKNINKIRKSSIEAANDFADQSLDLVYVDAEHDPISVRSDINSWKNKIKKGGILCGHDFMLPHIYTILYEEGLINELCTYPDSSWSVIIK
jgi:predicted O-methyltransferase YrrM